MNLAHRRPNKTTMPNRQLARLLTAPLAGLILLGLAAAPPVEAVPKQIVILRHGEKQDAYRLCGTGQQRSQALVSRYLGKGATDSILPAEGPAGIFAITLHTLELASPTAQSWGLPIQLYSVVPLQGLDRKAEVLQLNQRTQQAASDVLTDPRWDGKVVVMVWEHDHIAKKKLEHQFPDENVTLRQLLHLDRLPKTAAVPHTWQGGNYDYFWIVDYGHPGSVIPTGFHVLKQAFPAPYQQVPSNDWGTAENLPKSDACKS